MSLQRIQIKGFKSIRELDLELRNLNVLIGANGAGKSNFMSMFRMLNEMVEGRFQVFVGRAGGAEKLLRYGSKTTPRIYFRLTFQTPNLAFAGDYWAYWEPTANDQLAFLNEGVNFQEKKRLVPFHFENEGDLNTKLYDISKTVKAPQVTKYVDEVIETLKSWKVYHFHDTSFEARVKKTVNINDNAFLRPDAANLAAYLYLLKATKPPIYERIVKTIQLVAPFFDDFVLRPDPLNEESIRLEWREKGWDTYLNADMLSDGTLRFICLATLLLQPELPSIILLDEPEIGLHPHAIELLAELLRSSSLQSQVIIATQSVTLINQFAPEDIIVVDRTNEQSTFKRLNHEELTEWLEDYNLGELWEKGIVGGKAQYIRAQS